MGKVARLAGLLAVLGGLGGTNAEAMVTGILRIGDYISGVQNAYVDIANYPSGVTDGYDGGPYDNPFLTPPSGTGGDYSNIAPYDSSNPKLKKDSRLTTTTHNVFDVELVYNGTTSSSKTNYFNFSFLSSDVFGNERLALQQTDTSGNPIGSSYDIRQIIAGTLGGSLNPSAGRFNLPNLPAATYNVNTPYAHYAVSISSALATIALSTPVNDTIITGGTGTLGATVTNSAASGSNNLNYTLAAAVQTGAATLGAVSPDSGSLAPGVGEANTVSATSTNLGVNTVTFTATDASASNSPQTLNATLTVMDHSNASLAPGSTLTTQTIDFGNVLKGANVASQSYSISNRAPNTATDNTANLKLTAFGQTGDAALSTNLTTFGGATTLAAGSTNTYTASLSTANYTTSGSKTISMSASQLLDDSALPGAGGNNNNGLQVVLQANVGNATASNTNSTSAFGSSLSAVVTGSGTYQNLESRAATTSGTGGAGLVGSTATLLAGTNNTGSPETVEMSWRTQTADERNVKHLLSDVVKVAGTGANTFVLQMDYNPDLLPLGSTSEPGWASKKAIYLAHLNPLTGKWDNAAFDDVGSPNGAFHLSGWPSNDLTLGDWGVDTLNHLAWAVLNYEGVFAVVPEPGTLLLVGTGALAALGLFVRRRK